MTPDALPDLAERARRARELNDTLIQRFTGIILQLDGVRNSLQQQSNPLADELSRILDQSDRILREARALTGATNPPIVE